MHAPPCRTITTRRNCPVRNLSSRATPLDLRLYCPQVGVSEQSEICVRRLSLWLILLLPCYVAWRLLSAFHLGPPGLAIGVAALFGISVLIRGSFRARGIRNRAAADRLSWIGMISMGLFSSLLVLTLLRDLLLLGVRLLVSPDQAMSWVTASAAWTLIVAGLITLAGLVLARKP